MKKSESYSERVGATVTPELKDRMRALVEQGAFSSEADLVREALAQYVENPGGSQPVASASTPGIERLAGLVSLMIYTNALVGSQILSLLTGKQIQPASLIVSAVADLARKSKR